MGRRQAMSELRHVFSVLIKKGFAGNDVTQRVLNIESIGFHRKVESEVVYKTVMSDLHNFENFKGGLN